MRLTYKGRRKNGKVLVHAYETDHAVSTVMMFKKALLGSFIAIGNIIEAEDSGSGVKNAKLVQHATASDSLITQWSVEERAAVEMVNALKVAARKSDTHIDALIKAVKDNTSSYSDRRNIGLYILSKLL